MRKLRPGMRVRFRDRDGRRVVGTLTEVGHAYVSVGFGRREARAVLTVERPDGSRRSLNPADILEVVA